MVQAAKGEGLERPQVRRDPVTGQWRYVTTKQMLEADATRPKVERAVEEFDRQMWGIMERQRMEDMEEFKRKMRRHN